MSKITLIHSGDLLSIVYELNDGNFEIDSFSTKFMVLTEIYWFLYFI